MSSQKSTESKQNNIRCFSIIAHINHGKSTLADRFLEITGTIGKGKMKEQILDQMDLERERGITIKMQPCLMEYQPTTGQFTGKRYQLNLIDTPGHMDFGYEVERSLAAVEAVVLLVDVVSGIQAQTLANLRLAQEKNLVIIPVLNKIDICPSEEQLQKVKAEIVSILNIAPKDILAVSAKTGENVEQVLEAVIEKAPPPAVKADAPLKALVFDSFYDNYQGVIAFVRVFEGGAVKGDSLFLIHQNKLAVALGLGVFKPNLVPKAKLGAGEIGYIATGIKEPTGLRIGETITSANSKIEAKPLPGYREPAPVVFANLFPSENQNFEVLKQGLDKLRLNDTSLVLSAINNPFLGRGFRAGFLGMLHLEVAIERLKREFQTEVIITSPSVVLKVDVKGKPEILVHSAAELPEPSRIEAIKEPWVELALVSPTKYISKIHQLLSARRAVFERSDTLESDVVVLRFKAPLAEIIEDFLDRLKSATEGFASFSYQLSSYQKSNMVKLDFLVSREIKPSLSKIVHRDKAQSEAKDVLKKLKEHLPPKAFAQALQAVIGGTIIARENVRAIRKDVTAPLYGGDVTRKRKLLEKQKKGKKQLAAKGTTTIPHQVYLKLLRK